MAIKDTEILFASLVGSRLAKTIPRFSSIQNELSKHVLPPIPFLPIKNETKIHESSGSVNARINLPDAKKSAEQQFFPFYFVDDKGQKWLLPYEPIINIKGKNNIVKRKVAKADGLIGSIKERWSQDDYEITITGILVGDIERGSLVDSYPISDFIKLSDFMTSQKDLEVYCEPLQLLGINRIVIEDFDFPFTKGENVQAYVIKAYSDFQHNLLLDQED